MSQKTSTECLCGLVREGAELLAEIATSSGKLSEEQLARAMEHVRKAYQASDNSHVKLAA